MSNYPHYPVPPRRPVPGSGPAHVPSQAQSGGPPHDPAAPALPPRPASTPNRLMAQTTLNFPPPPRSPNRPPQLPPRPGPQQPVGQAPCTARPAYAMAPGATPVPPTQTAPGQSYPPPPGPPPATAPAYQQGYFPPPPPGPPPAQAHPASTSAPSASHPSPGRESPPPPYTEGTHTAPEKQAPAASSPPPPPPPPPPQIHVQDSGASTTQSTTAGDEALSMIERLRIRPISSVPAPAPSPAAPSPSAAPRSFAAELPADPVSPPAVQPSQETRAGPRAAYVSDVPDEEPPVSHTAHTGAEHAAYREEETPPPPVRSPSQQKPAPAPPPTASASVPPPAPSFPTGTPTGTPSGIPSGNPTRLPTAIHCIDVPVTFPTWWYTHKQTPGVYICSKCYMDHIYPTAFRNAFSAQYCTSGEERRCRFNVPRITDQLLPDAVARGTLDTLILYMNQRLAIQDCKGAGGAKPSDAVKWYEVKNNQLPGFVACEACYQDIACISQFAYAFQEAVQPATDVWMCDLCVPFTRREYEQRTKANDWPMFVKEAKARLDLPPCAKMTPMAFNSRKWFTPVSGRGPSDAVLCVACYCDYILHSGQEGLWQEEKKKLFGGKSTNTCIMGMFHLSMAVTAAYESENKDWPRFWSTLNRIAYQEKPCVPDGIVDGRWYTFPSQPAGFNVCGGCHAGVLQSLQIDQFFLARTANGPRRGEAHVCALNAKSDRNAAYRRLLLQTWMTADSTAWEDFARQRAVLPPCPRITDGKNRLWYGWPECVICADCYFDVVRGTALDTPQRMAFYTPTRIETPHICEMYSPRMRQLYREACATSPPSTASLFAHVQRRRAVYWQTIPVCRQMVMEQQLLASQSKMNLTASSFYNAAGGIAAIGNHYTYAYGLGGQRFENAFQVQGAMHNAQANALASQVGGSKTYMVGQLEQQWQDVE